MSREGNHHAVFLQEHFYGKLYVYRFFFASYLPVEATYRFSIYFFSAAYYDEFIKLIRKRE